MTRESVASGVFLAGYVPSLGFGLASISPEVMLESLWTGIYYITGVLSVGLSLTNLLIRLFKIVRALIYKINEKGNI